jgi:GT2 family glycosyltransferase
MAHNPSQPDLSIVIVNYRVKRLLLDCLASIYRREGKTPLSIECIVIDNASGDGSVEAVQASYPDVKLLANAQNRYFSAAYTQGIWAATGRYVLALNPDMIVEGDTLAQLVRHMDARPEVGAATTTMRFPDGTLQRTGSRFVTFGYLLYRYTLLGKLFTKRLRAYEDWLWYADWDRRTERPIDLLPGSCIIASQATWLAAGGFDRRMLLYFSDDYVSRAVQKLGKQTVYLISDGIIHYEGASSRNTQKRIGAYFRDLLVYTRLVFGRPAQIVLGILIIPTWVVQRLKAG